MQYKGINQKYGERRLQEIQARDISSGLIMIYLRGARQSADMGLTDFAESELRDAQEEATNGGLDLRRMVKGDAKLTEILDRISSQKPSPSAKN